MNQKFWRNNPAFRIAIPLIIGIVLAVLGELQSSTFIIAAGSLVFMSFTSFIFRKNYNLRFVTGFLLFSTIVLLGISLVIIKTDSYKDKHFSNYLTKESVLVAKIDEALIKKANSHKTILTVDYVLNEEEVVPTEGNILTYVKIDSGISKLQYGDQLIFKGYVQEVTAPSNPEQFNYKHYLSLNNINHQVFIGENSYQVIGANTGSKLIELSYQIRDYLYTQLKENGLAGDELRVASALLLGYRELLNQELVQAYSSAGAMHVLAVSGLHVGILFFILKFSLGFLLRLKRGKYVFTLVILVALWCYAMITGFSPSVLRASTMFSFILVGEQLINRKVSIYNTLAVSAILLLIINPYLIFEVGFQLSYLAVVGIVYLQPRIYKLLSPRNIILDNAWKITAVSIAAQVATFPLGLYYFHQFPVYFFVSNLIVIPAATVILYLGVLLFITSPIGGISVVIGTLLGFVIKGLNFTVGFTENLPFSLVQEISISRLDTYLLYLFIITLLVFFYYRKVRLFYLSGMFFLAFLTIQLVDRFYDLDRKDFTVYSIRNQTAFEFSIGEKTFFCASQSLYDNKAQMLFNVRHNWYRKNITNVTYISIDSISVRDDYIFSYNGIIRFYNKTYAYLTPENFRLIKQTNPNLLIISNEHYKLLYKIEKEIPFGCKLIFDSTIKKHFYEYWKKRLSNHQTISTSSKYFYEDLAD